MRQLYVSIENEGRMREVGCISGNSEYDASFSYSEDYLSSSAAMPISISLPLRPDPYGPEATGNFFEGLLPEGFLRRKIAENNRTDSGGYFDLLSILGAECLGAVQIVGDNYHELTPEYRPLDHDLMCRLASEGATVSADLVVRTHLSLTGASGKVGVYLASDGKWYLPVGTAPSTHILKQSHIRYDHIVQNEQLALKTAAALGIDTPESEIIRREGSEDSHRSVIRSKDGTVLLATRRFDRIIPDNAPLIDGQPVPRRLHQEDFAQAMGIPSSNKYEHEGDEHMKRMFDMLRKYSASPIEDQMKLWDVIVFHYLIGNTDGHIKNFSLLYDSSLGSVRLAPAYDIVSTVVYDTHSAQMAFNIGGDTNWDQLGRESFVRATEAIGLNKKIFMKRFDEMRGRFIPALIQTAEEMQGDGFDEALDIAHVIVDKHGWKVE